MPNKPKVSIITPSYNQGRFIRATIQSVLSQDYPNIEYIIMDGGSTDETASVAGEYRGRLTYISERDRGQSHAINKGFQRTTGSILAWLNSDDLLLPGAVKVAVEALERDSRLGAVYGEGYRIDEFGKVTGRFPATEPFNLWKLIYLWDYILQQTCFFQKSALHAVGFLDEGLNWGMDWDLLIRIGKRFPLGLIPEYMGCLREYPQAKTFSGAGPRFRELVTIMRRHGNQRFPPGYVVYGLDTYEQICCSWIRRWLPGLVSGRVSTLLSSILRGTIDRTALEAQGLYQDGWATKRMHYMLPEGEGGIEIAGEVPDLGASHGRQTLRVECEGKVIAEKDLPAGNFRIFIPAGKIPSGAPPELTVRSSTLIIPSRNGRSADHRRLCFRLKHFRWVERGQSSPPREGTSCQELDTSGVMD